MDIYTALVRVFHWVVSITPSALHLIQHLSNSLQPQQLDFALAYEEESASQGSGSGLLKVVYFIWVIGVLCTAVYYVMACP
ncbi:hypothetical protein [Paenibacillus puerhi]|uniref:hypothetical protein n=1 Tax=Paenibacillus puerhi TaxID=2692622 RepID=UPI001358E3C9|nr:hypothetical protein [Paenibacillus puerhi]